MTFAKKKPTVPGWRKVLDDFLKHFEIDSKEQGRTLLDPWGTQLYFLDELARGMDDGVRFFVAGKGRQYGLCVAPETKVLTATLEWIRIADLKVGQELVAVDEATPPKHHGRKMRTAAVQGVVVVRHPAYKITFHDGREVICTGKHPWLSVGADGAIQAWRSITPTRGKRGNTRKCLRVGSRVRSVASPWGPSTLDDAWFGGMLDGEGSIDTGDRAGVRVNVAQRKGPVWDRLVKYAKSHGYNAYIKEDLQPTRNSKFGTAPVPRIEFARCDELFRLIGQTRPVRFLGRPFWEGRELPGKRVGAQWAEIIKIESIGARTLIDLQTSTGTYIAEGLVSHNTTIMIPVDVLWALTHPGIEGAIIANNPKVGEVCRAQINDIQTRLPESHRVPLTGNSRDKMEWTFRDGTKSTIHLLVAGTTERKTDLAKGHGLAFIHGTEVGEWGSETALNSLIASLAQKNPDRLYVFESTGEGNNLFARLWRKSLDHPARRCIFVPWWTHDLYKLDRRTVLFKHYMANPLPSDEEQDIIAAAKTWGHTITDSELAWYRSMSGEMTCIEDMQKNYPSTPDEMFQLGGAAFIPRKPLNAMKAAAHDRAFNAYQVALGNDVGDMKINPLGMAIDEEDGHTRGADLRVWEEPKPRGTYCIGVNPSDEEGGVSSIQVVRAYSDCIEQVAEFASESIEAYHLAWVAAYLAGWYKNSWVNIELEHGGGVVFRELQNLRNMVSMGKLGQQDIFGAMIFYLYNRIDNVSGASRTWHWRSNSNNEAEIFADFKNSFLMNRAILHSIPLAGEMATLIHEDNYVGGDDDTDDSRSRAMCIAIRTWVDHVRLGMVGEGKTRERENKADVGAAPATFLENIVTSFMRQQRAAL